MKNTTGSTISMNILIFRKVFFSLLATIMVLSTNQSWAEVYRVKAGSVSNEDGLTWTTAFSSIQPAVDMAFNDGGGEVWVASGIYTGTEDYIVIMKEGVNLYGGFTGDETYRAERHWDENPTVIDGEGEETRCGVLGADHAELDGFYIQNCYTTGMRNDNTSPKVINCTFTKNIKDDWDYHDDGGGVTNINSSAIITDCNFTENRAGNSGGGICNRSSSPTITNCTFTDNLGGDGGGILNSNSTPIISNCLFLDNYARDDGGGISVYKSEPLITNCLFIGNRSRYNGGGINNDESGSSITNCTFLNNRAIKGGGIYNDQTTYNITPVVTNCIIWGNSTQIEDETDRVTVTYCCVEKGFDGEGNIQENPSLNPGTYELLPRSMCLNRGDPNTSDIPGTDLLGQPRVQSGRIDIGAFEYAPGTQSTFLTVVLEPQEVMSLNANWNLDDKVSHESGKTIEVYPGEFKIEFSPLGNWQAPESRTIVVPSNGSSLTYQYSHAPGHAVSFVDVNATGTNTGESWENAFTDIQTALSEFAGTSYHELWIAKGTYTSSTDNVIYMRYNIHLYGGFAGKETARNQRNWTENKTIIDGQGERRCVHGSNNATLDGFILTNGHGEYGSAIYNYENSPTISNCVIKENIAQIKGAGIANFRSSPFITNCIFTENRTDGYGAGILNQGSAPTIINCIFSKNITNSPKHGGGGIFNAEESSPLIINCEFIQNTTKYRGAGIENYSASPRIMNCTFLENTAEREGSGLHNFDSTPTIINSIFWGNDVSVSDYNSTTTMTYSCIQGGHEGEGNIDTDPQLDPARFRLLPSSPCIDAGIIVQTDMPETDLDNQKRIQNRQVDMGPIEYIPGTTSTYLTINLGPQEVVPLTPKWQLNEGLWNESGATIEVYPDTYMINFTSHTDWEKPQEISITIPDSNTTKTYNYSMLPGNNIWFVNHSASGNNNGHSWEDAYTEIQPAIDSASDAGFGEVWVAAGTYKGSGDNVIEIKESVYLYGGFAGNETSRSQRDWKKNKSIIDGEASRRCVFCPCDTLLDGFTITRGLTNSNGGGMWILYANPTIQNCFFAHNIVDEYGGGLYNYNSTPHIINCIFKYNSSYLGGAIYNDLTSSPIIKNCIFSFNGINKTGGAIFNSDNTNPEISNCLFKDDVSMYGCSIYTYRRSSPIITNSIFQHGKSEIVSLRGGTPCVTYCCFQDDYDGEGNINADPLFNESTYRLSPNSPCIDSGTPDASELFPTDLSGAPRIQNNRVDMGPYESSPNTSPVPLTITLGPQEVLTESPKWRIDHGPWLDSNTTVQVYPGEYQIDFFPRVNWQEPEITFVNITDSGDQRTFNYTPSPGNHIWFVDNNASGSGTGESWADALTEIQSALDKAKFLEYGEIWVADGTYTGTGAYVLEMENNIQIYGGFNGNETTRNQRKQNVKQSFIDGEFSRRGVLGADNAILDGFTITNCNGYGDGGGMVIKLTSPTVANCIFTGNTATNIGGGMYTKYSSAMIENCIFINNQADYGGGLRNDDSAPTVRNCTFTNNTGRKFIDGIDNYHSELKVENCILWEDSGGIGNYECSSSVKYSCIPGGYEGEGNIDIDPLLDPVTLQLLPASPCIDTGNPNSTGLPGTDLLGVPRIQNGQVDMGAFEYTPETEFTSLTINLGPAEIHSASPKWRIGNSPWIENEATINLAPGDYTISFSPLVDWQEPEISVITVTSSPNVMTMAYTPSPGKYRWYVNNNATGNNNGDSWKNAFTEIQPAIDIAFKAGIGEIWVAKGTYTGVEQNTVPVVRMKENVHIYGGFQGDETSRKQRNWITNKTIIDGENRHICAYGENDSTLDGFTVTNVNSSSYSGAMYNNSASPTVVNCTFTENHEVLYGAAIYNKNCSPNIINCLFTNNSADYGKNISNINSSPTITNCTFAEYRTNYGYCLYNDEASSPIISNCIIWNYRNITFDLDGSTSIITYSCLNRDHEGIGNINTNPLFTDINIGDYRLLPDSPCIDAGTVEGAPETDIRGLARPQDNGVDMGAYEFYRPVDQVEGPSTLIADLSVPSDQDGWFFNRPEMYRDIDAQHNEQGAAWDLIVSGNEMTFGYLESPTLSVLENNQPVKGNTLVGETGPGYLYRATLLVSSDLEDSSEAPVIRVRTSSESFQRSDLIVVSSEHEGDVSPNIEGRLYTTYFQLPDNESNFRLDLDVLNFNPNDTDQGTVFLQYAEVEYLGVVNQLGASTEVLSQNFVADGVSGWATNTAEASIPAPDTFSANVGEGLLIRGSEQLRQEPDSPIAQFGCWTKQCTCFPLYHALYHIRWTVGTDAFEVSREQLPTFRLRFNDASMKLASLVNIDSVSQNINLPSVSNPVTYDSWFVVPPEIAGNNWNLSFDYLYVEKPAPIADDPSIALILQSVEVMRYDIP